jgi:alanine dehydrogenase
VEAVKSSGPEVSPVTTTRFLTSEQVSGLASPTDYVDAVREGYRQRGEGAPAEPRQRLDPEDPPGLLTSYLAVLPDTGAMGGYVYAAGFADRDTHFLAPVFDAESGRPVAVLDGASMNPHKTGAAGAVGVDALARRNASVAAVIGSGAQARGQLRAAATVREFDAVRVYSPTPDHRRSFAAAFDDRLSADVRAVEDAATAVDGADVVITATTATEPVFDGDDLAAGAHVTAVGQYHPDRRELDHRTIERATYVPDLRERAFQDAGSFLSALEAGVIDEEHIHAELGAVVAGHAPGRTAADELTVFDSGGTAIETVAAASLLADRAAERDVGSTIEFFPASEAFGLGE